LFWLAMRCVHTDTWNSFHKRTNTIYRVHDCWFSFRIFTYINDYVLPGEIISMLLRWDTNTCARCVRKFIENFKWKRENWRLSGGLWMKKGKFLSAEGPWESLIGCEWTLNF
jgi:hypothetical protein